MSTYQDIALPTVIDQWVRETNALSDISNTNLVEYLINVGHKVMTTPELHGLFQAGILTQLVMPKALPQDNGDGESDAYTLDMNMFGGNRSISDCCINMAWMASMIQRKFPNFIQFDEGTKLFKTLSARYCIRAIRDPSTNRLITYNIASDPRMVQTFSISEIKRAIAQMKSSYPSYYIGHMYINVSGTVIPDRPDWSVEIAKTQGYAIVWMTLKAITEKTDYIEAYIENALKGMANMRVRVKQ